jgi:hypothetical protein
VKFGVTAQLALARAIDEYPVKLASVKLLSANGPPDVSDEVFIPVRLMTFIYKCRTRLVAPPCINKRFNKATFA